MTIEEIKALFGIQKARRYAIFIPGMVDREPIPKTVRDLWLKKVAKQLIEETGITATTHHTGYWDDGSKDLVQEHVIELHTYSIKNIREKIREIAARMALALNQPCVLITVDDKPEFVIRKESEGVK
jgi:NifB/MoaA-like Fe-S oxidoreductase